MISRTVAHYNQKASFLIRDYNRRFPLPYYFSLMIPKAGNYNIADLGAGLVCTLGGMWTGNINIYASDILKEKYDKILSRYGTKLLIPIEYQNMEALTYSDDFFDIVHCVNALDHTENAPKAISEMIRICKPNGWIYLRHGYKQRRRFKGMHRWDIYIKSNKCIISNLDEWHYLNDFGNFNSHMEGNLIISTVQIKA